MVGKFFESLANRANKVEERFGTRECSSSDCPVDCRGHDACKCFQVDIVTGFQCDTVGQGSCGDKVVSFEGD